MPFLIGRGGLTEALFDLCDPFELPLSGRAWKAGTIVYLPLGSKTN